jgi:hypothetical protein
MPNGTNVSELFVRAVPYVAKILGGSRPGDLPIEQPTRFAAVLARADHVIE